MTPPWMAVEAVVGITAGILAHSLLLMASGIDSVIEFVSGAGLLRRLRAEARGRSLEGVEQAEKRAAWLGGAGLALLALYIVVTPGWVSGSTTLRPVRLLVSARPSRQSS